MSSDTIPTDTLICITPQERDNLNYYQIRTKDAEEYGKYMNQNYLELHDEYVKTKDHAASLEQSNKDKDAMMLYQDGETLWWKTQFHNEQDLKKKELRKSWWIGTAKGVVGGLAGFGVGYGLRAVTKK